MNRQHLNGINSTSCSLARQAAQDGGLPEVVIPHQPAEDDLPFGRIGIDSLDLSPGDDEDMLCRVALAEDHLARRKLSRDDAIKPGAHVFPNGPAIDSDR